MASGWHYPASEEPGEWRRVELVLDNGQRTQLRRISVRTIERLLAAGRRTLQPRGSAGTRPGSLLKLQIPVKSLRSGATANRTLRPWFVRHDGGNACGEFTSALAVTDVATVCTEVRAVRNQAQTGSVCRTKTKCTSYRRLVDVPSCITTAYVRNFIVPNYCAYIFVLSAFLYCFFIDYAVN